MLVENTKNLIEQILNLRDSEFINGRLLSFKTSQNTDTNPHISLKYSIIDTLFPKKYVIENVKNLLSYFNNKYLNESNLFSQYLPTNSKDTTDYLKLEHYNFQDDSFKSGTDPDIKSDVYKVEYLLNSLNVCTNDAESKEDYKGLRYSAFELHTNTLGSIYIINKTNPLYKPRDIVFTIDCSKDNDNSTLTNKQNEFKFGKLSKTLFKVPSNPSIVVLGDYCFFIVDGIESVFGFEQHNQSICNSVINSINDDLNIDENSLNLLKRQSSLAKNFNLFADYDNSTLEKIKNKDTTTLEILKNKFKISIDNDLNLSFSNIKEAERFIHFITHRAYPNTFDVNEQSQSNQYIYARSYKKIEVPD